MSDEHNDIQRAYYTDRPAPRLRIERADTPYVRRHVDEVLRFLPPDEDALILDVGCGAGKYTAALAATGRAVEGLDLTPALIDQFRVSLPELTAHVADAATPPVALESRYDAAVGFFFLHHVADLRPILAGVKRMLKPGGTAVFIEPNPRFFGYYVQIAVTPRMSWRAERGMLKMTPRRFEDAGRAVGFNTFQHHAFGAMPPAIANRSWGRRAERLFEALPGWTRVGAFRVVAMR